MLREAHEETGAPRSPPPSSRYNFAVSLPSFGTSAILANTSRMQQETPKPNGHSAFIPSVSPADQPEWLLGKDPDPMMQALIDNMLAIEKSLLELRHKATLFQESAAFMWRTMGDQASHVARLCKDDATLARPTLAFSEKISSSATASDFNHLVEMLELKVFEPINVNLSVLRDIKARAQERDAMRKYTSRGVNGLKGNQQFAQATAGLFEELAALERHRYDVIRGIYEGLRASQRRFFSGIVDTLSSPELDPPPKMIPSVAPPTTVTPYPSGFPTERKDTPSPIRAEIVVAVPVDTVFDPSADKVKFDDAPAFSRFNQVVEDDLDDDVADFAEYKRMNRPIDTKKPGSPRGNGRAPAGLSIPSVPEGAALINTADEDEFDTV